MTKGAWSLERLSKLRGDLLAEMKFEEHESLAGILVEDAALMRYVGQSYSVEVPYSFPHDLASLTRDFRAIHEQLYGFSTEEDWEIEAIRVTASVNNACVDVQPPTSCTAEQINTARNGAMLVLGGGCDRDTALQS